MAPNEFPPSRDADSPGAADEIGSARAARDPGRSGSLGLGPAGGIGAWLGRLASDEAASTRAQLAWMQRQAAEEGTFAGVLADLAERGRPVALHLHNGRRHRGALTGLGRDFVVLVTGEGREVLVHLDSVTSVRTVPGEPTTIGDRPVHSDASWHDALAVLGEQRERVVLSGPEPGAVLAGEVRAVGVDVMTLRLDGGGGTAYVRLASVSDVSVDESG